MTVSFTSLTLSHTSSFQHNFHQTCSRSATFNELSHVYFQLHTSYSASSYTYELSDFFVFDPRHARLVVKVLELLFVRLGVDREQGHVAAAATADPQRAE